MDIKSKLPNELQSEEKQYLDIVNDILTKGIKKMDRTGTGTLSLFGSTMRFNLEGNILPLLTTKKMHIKSIIAELLWFISGSTDNNVLKKQGVNIWTANAKSDGDCGPIYGYQWRSFNGDKKNGDQLASAINEIKTNPNSRRIIINAWNPLQISDMVLPPCHVLYQFICEGEFLKCMLYQRSGDFGLGIPFNIASASLLTHLIASVTGKIAKELVHVICDSHVYLNHVEQLKEQLKRDTFTFPTIRLIKKCKNIEEYTINDIAVDNYKFHDAIKMPMSK